MSALDRWDAMLQQCISDLKYKIQGDEALGTRFMRSEGASEETISAVSGRLHSSGRRVTYDIFTRSLDQAMKWSQYVAEFSTKYPFRLNGFQPDSNAPASSLRIITEDGNHCLNLACLTQEAKTLLVKSVALMIPYNVANNDRLFSSPSYWYPSPELMIAVQWLLVTHDRKELLTDTPTTDEEARILFLEYLDSDEYQAECGRIEKEWNPPAPPPPSRDTRVSWWKRWWQWLDT